MRPTLKFLNKELIEQIISQARDILCRIGVQIHNESVVTLLSDHGARIEKDKYHVYFTEEIIDRALKSSPVSFKLYDVYARHTHHRV